MRSSCEAFATNSLRARVELRELDAHPLERGRELAELVVAEIDHGLVERPLRDPVGGTLEAPDAGARGASPRRCPRIAAIASATPVA